VGSARPDPADPKKLVVSPGGSELINVKPAHGQSLDFYSEAQHGDALITLEVMVPKESNSGIYVMGEYEVQVRDSFGKEPAGWEMSGIYFGPKPLCNASKPAGEWNKFYIDFRAPKFDKDGKKIANAKFIKTVLNERVTNEHVEMPKPTPTSLTGEEHAVGPIMFQGDHGPVTYRNLKVTLLPAFQKSPATTVPSRAQ
jgi:hypothetical protein